ncbi:MAG: hypothetical protein ACYCX4_14820 [Bacillota bacterium]
MKKHGVILTDNYKAQELLRFDTEEEAEKHYQDNKKKGVGVVKVNIEKAHEHYVTTVNIP